MRPFFKISTQKIQPCKFSAPKDQKQKSYGLKTPNNREYQPPYGFRQEKGTESNVRERSHGQYNAGQRIATFTRGTLVL